MDGPYTSAVDYIGEYAIYACSVRGGDSSVKKPVP